MRVFVCESVCAGDLPGPVTALPRSLVREGAGMLRSIVEDLAALQRVEEVRAIIHPDLDALLGAVPPKAVVERLGGPGARTRFDELAASCRWALVIAPETAGLLEARSRRVLAVGGALLGSSPEAVSLAGDKARLGERLRDLGVPTPPCIPIDIDDPPGVADVPFPAVLKPRDGAGALHTWRVDGPATLRDAIETARAGGAPRAMLLSPLVPGTAASASFIVGAGGAATALAPGFQRLEEGRRVRYLGGRIPLEPDALRRRATALARRAIDAVEGLRGFVGVDLVLGASEADDAVIEVNPRLTTSYLGLRRYHGPWSIVAHWLEVASAGSRAPAGDSLFARGNGPPVEFRATPALAECLPAPRPATRHRPPSR